MNILPITLTFILLLSMVSLSFFQSTRHIDYLAHQKKSYMKVKRELLGKLEAEALREKLPPKKDTEKGSPAPRTHYTSPRLNEELKNSAKLNISSLFSVSSAPNLALERILTNLLIILYGEKNFFKTDIATHLVKALIAQGKNKSPEILTDLYPEDTELKEIYYKMLKSKTPLEDYITLSTDDKRKPICFKTASIPLLKATFGPDIAKTILQKEEEKYFAGEKGSSILTKEEFQEIVTNSTLLSLLQFQHPSKETEIIRQQDNKSGISLSYTTNHK